MTLMAVPTDEHVPVALVADMVTRRKTTVAEVVGGFKRLGWKSCTMDSDVPPVMAEVAIDYFNLKIDTVPDDDQIVTPPLPEYPALEGITIGAKPLTMEDIA